MCGIIGVTGASDPFRIAVEGLRTLEYRGYDSAGIALSVEGGELCNFRAAERASSIELIAGRAGEVPAGVKSALGHTRWATHGAPVEKNAHPHLDCTGRVAIVHNGIIENYRELAAELRGEGHQFLSDTDSEVIAHLIERELVSGCRLVEALRRVTAILRGDFSIGALSADEPEVIVGARCTSPMLVGIGAGVGLLASDVAALVGSVDECFSISDNEVVEVRPGSFTIYDSKGEEVKAVPMIVQWDVESAQKGGFADFMSKEIREQPQAIRETLIGRIHEDGRTELEEFGMDTRELEQLRRVVFIACGSSYHACLSARQMMESLAHVQADVDIASEFRYREAVFDEHTIAVAVSQSGETVDTLHAMREARCRGAHTVALTNVVDSVMAREADGVLYTRAGPEIGVASTKCHVAQLALLEAFALHLGAIRGTIDEASRHAHIQALLSCATLVERAIAHADDVLSVAERFVSTQNFYYLGRRLGYPVALEGALKLKELAYVRAEGYAAGEMKHGPISLIEPGAVVVAVATRTPLWEKVMSNVEEMRARGATIVAVADEGDEQTAALVDAVLEVPHTDELCSPMVNVVPLQLFAYEIARLLGNDVDRPRNLAKVVTVE